MKMLKEGNYLMKKRISLLLLAVLLLVSLVAGCGGKVEDQPTTEPTTKISDDKPVPEGGEEPGNKGITFPLEETAEFTFWVNLYESYLKSMTSLDDHPIHQELEKLTNVHVYFLHPTYGSEGEAFGVLLASQEYPDAMTTAYHTKGNGDLFYNEIIIDLTKYLDEYMPAYKAVISSDKAVLRDVKLDTGEIVAIRTIYETVPLPWRGLVVRRDLLNKLGLSIPETIEDWETALSGFRDLGVEKPLFIANNGLTDNTFEPVFGVGGRLYVDKGTVKYGPYEPGYRQYLELMHDWYAKGLIDRDFAGNAGFPGMLGLPEAEVINSGKVGASNAQSHTLGSQLVDTGVANIPDMYFYGVYSPVKTRGASPDFSKVAGSGRAAGSYGITVDCPEEKLPVVLSYFDFLYKEDNRLLLNYGIRGVSWEYDVNGVPQYTDLINASSYDGVNTFHVYDYSLFSMPYHMIDRELIQGRAQEILDMQQKWVVTGTDMSVMPALTLTDEENRISSSYLNDLNTFADEMTVKFILGEESFDNYDKFLKTMESQGIREVLEVQQAAYDRYLSR